MRFRVTDERAWVREFAASSPEELAEGIRRAWDDRIAESPLSRPTVAGSVRGVHPALAHRARTVWIDRWLADRMAQATADSDIRSWEAQAALWRGQAARELGADEHASPLRLHVWAPGDEGAVSMWSTLAVPYRGGWRCHPYAPRVARATSAERAAELFAGAEAICQHARNLSGLADRVGVEVRKALHPPLRSV